MKKPRNVSRGMMFAVAATIVTSINVVVFRYILRSGEDPLNLIAWTNIMPLAFWIFLFKKHQTEFRKLSRKMVILMVFIGIAGALGINYFQVLALKNTTAVNFSFIYRTVTVFTVIFAWMFLKEKITYKKGILVGLILFGSFLITTEGQRLTLTRGDIYALLMAASAAIVANVLIKHTVNKMHPDLSASVISSVNGISLLIAAVATGVFTIPEYLGLVIFGSALFTSLILLRNRAYKYASASFVSMIFGLSPLFVVVLSFIFLGETLKPIQLLGGSIIIAATVFTEKFRM